MAFREWYYVKDGAQQGPVPEQELVKLLGEGVLLPSTLVWTEGAEDWRPASEFRELSAPLAQTAAPPPPPRPLGWSAPLSWASRFPFFFSWRAWAC